MQNEKDMKKTTLIPTHLGVDYKPQDVFKSLNQDYDFDHQERALYYLPTYPDFAYTPVLQKIGLENNLFGIFETIFHFKQAFCTQYPQKRDLAYLNITMMKKVTGEFYLLIYWNAVLIHEIELGKRKFQFNFFQMNLCDDLANTKHLLLLPEELADQTHFINS